MECDKNNIRKLKSVKIYINEVDMVIFQLLMINMYIYVFVLKIDKIRKFVLKLSDINNSLSIILKSYEENFNGKKVFQNDNK